MNDSMNKEGNLNPFFINYNFLREDWKKIAEDLKIENSSTDRHFANCCEKTSAQNTNFKFTILGNKLVQETMILCV